MAEAAQRRRGVGRAGAAALLAIGLAATACSSTSGTDTTGAPPTSRTVEPTAGTSTPPPGSSTPGTTESEPSPEAAAANLTAADLATGWADYPEDAEVLGEDQPHGCKAVSGMLDDRPDDSFADGTIIQYGDRLVFAQTNARVFETPADAQAFATYLLGETFIECRRAELERGLPATDPPLTIVSTGSHTGNGTTPYIGSFSYETQQVVDGVAQLVGASRHAIYVKGSVVIDLFTQIGGMEGDPPDLDETTNTMIDDGMQGVLERVGA